MKLSLPPKLVEKLVWIPVISFCKISIPTVMRSMAYYVETDRSCPPNRVTLGRTLICSHLSL